MDWREVEERTKGLTDEECRYNLAEYEKAMDLLCQEGLVVAFDAVPDAPQSTVNTFYIFRPKERGVTFYDGLIQHLGYGKEDLPDAVAQSLGQ